MIDRELEDGALLAEMAIDSFMMAMAEMDANAAHRQLSNGARQRVSPDDLRAQLSGPAYEQYDDYAGEVMESLLPVPDLGRQFYRARLRLAYGYGTRQCLAVLVRQGGDWSIEHLEIGPAER